jgi:hypothetical protein
VLGKNINKLVFAKDDADLKLTTSHPLANKVEINGSVFSSGVENRVYIAVSGTNYRTKESVGDERRQ